MAVLSTNEAMARAISVAEGVRGATGTNPWVGCVILDDRGVLIAEGATQPPGSAHAEVVALSQAGDRARGATVVVTLEPCAHEGKTPPCVAALIDAGVGKVIVGVEDPDSRVAGRGVEALREAGMTVEQGVLSDEVSEQLAAYLHHRRTGLPLVVLKLAATLDGRTAAPDGSSQWITGEAARADVAILRSQSDVIIVGAATVRADDPELTARTTPAPYRQPERIVLGSIPEGARVLPAREFRGELRDLIGELGETGVLQVLIEGGASVAQQAISANLVDRVVLYLAPAIMGGDDGAPLLRGEGAPSMDALKRGRLISVIQVGDDLRVEVAL